MSQAFFYTAGAVRRIRETVAHKKQDFLKAADWWRRKSAEELEQLVMDPCMPRSEFVLSYGDCPRCHCDLSMYRWRIDPFRHPWKVQCPSCLTLFPGNDFGSYYQSGLDDAGNFSWDRADSTFLKGDYADDGRGWMGKHAHPYAFIGAHHLFGVWGMLVMDGLYALTRGFTSTGDAVCLEKAEVLFNAVANRFPEYDYMSQGIMYEQHRKCNGYVGYWVRSCDEIMNMALCFDQLREHLRPDTEQRIQDNIFRDALRNRHKIESNFPETDIAILLSKAVTGVPREEIMKELDQIIRTGTQVDGTTGEKGFGGYTTILPRDLYRVLSLFALEDERDLRHILRSYPILQKTFSFHYYLLYQKKYIPNVGDMGGFGVPLAALPDIMALEKEDGFFFSPSKEWFLKQLRETYGDPVFDHMLRMARDTDSKEENLPDHSLVDYEGHRFAMFFSGQGKHQRSIWMTYGAGANHSHEDALHIGLYAKGLNLMPDNGYPPVNHGGWETPELNWYRSPQSHNIVVADGKRFTGLPEGIFLRYPKYGDKLFHCDTPLVKGICAQAKEYQELEDNRRLVMMVDISPEDFYLMDLSRVRGGTSHEKITRSTHSDLSPRGWHPAPLPEEAPHRFLRNFRGGRPGEPWETIFRVRDEYGVLPEKKEIFLRYMDFTRDCQAVLCESWVDTMRQEFWIPAVITRRKGAEGLSSVFLSVMEPYEKRENIRECRREGDDRAVLLSVTHEAGEDLIISCDGEAWFDQYGIRTDGQFCFLRRKNGILKHLVFAGGSVLQIHGTDYVKEPVRHGKVISHSRTE